MNKNDLVVHEIDIRNGIIALFDRRTRVLWTVSVADVKSFDMSALPARPRKPAPVVEKPDDDSVNQLPMFAESIPLGLRAEDFTAAPELRHRQLGGGQL